jgi:hypothetical protein
LANNLEIIRLYREWGFGRYTAPRSPQKTDIPNDFLESDCANLELALNRLRQYPDVKSCILESLGHLKNRQGDKWTMPTGASEKDCHLMA